MFLNGLVTSQTELSQFEVLGERNIEQAEYSCRDQKIIWFWFQITQETIKFTNKMRMHIIQLYRCGSQ